MIFHDRVLQRTLTSGTGTYTFEAAAMPSFDTFANAFADGEQTCYAAQEALDWEIGVGTIGNGGTTITRDQIIASSNSGNAVDWVASWKKIYCIIPACLLPVRGSAQPPSNDHIPLSGLEYFDEVNGVNYINTSNAASDHYWVSHAGYVHEAYTIGDRLPDGSIVAAQYDGNWLIVVPATLRILKRFGLYDTDTTLVAATNAGAVDGQLGLENTDELIAGYSDFNDGTSIGPETCFYARSLGKDWFIPNKNELTAIQANAATIDAADNSGGANTFSGMGTGLMWSTTERNATDHWAVAAADGTNSYEDKNLTSIFAVAVRREAT